MRSALKLVLPGIMMCLYYACKTQNTGWNHNERWSGFSTASQPKALQRHIKGLLYIPGGTFTMGRDEPLEFTDSDSMLLPPAMTRRVTVSDFYLSDHEVTNAEYREFTKWVRDSIALSILAQGDSSWYLDRKAGTLNWSRRPEVWADSSRLSELLTDEKPHYKRLNTAKMVYTWITDTAIYHQSVYPDTLAFLKYARYMVEEPGTRYYFCHPAFNDCPVVGVSWRQAMAYCHWLTWQIEKDQSPPPSNKKYIDEGGRMEVRLPTEAEWEYAAYGCNPDLKFEYMHGRRTYPWEGLMLTDNKANYLANFGNIIDGNGIYAKYYVNDGAFLPAKVKSYPANAFGLYDMAGNVAEWTLYAPDLDFEFI